MPSDNLIAKNESRDITESFAGLHFVGSDILGKGIKDIFITDFYRHPVAVVFDDGGYTSLCPDDAGKSLSIVICNKLIEDGLVGGYIGGQSIVSSLMKERGFYICGKKLVSLDFRKSKHDPHIFLQTTADCSFTLEGNEKLTISYVYDCGYIVDVVLKG